MYYTSKYLRPFQNTTGHELEIVFLVATSENVFDGLPNYIQNIETELVLRVAVLLCIQYESLANCSDVWVMYPRCQAIGMTKPVALVNHI